MTPGQTFDHLVADAFIRTRLVAAIDDAFAEVFEDEHAPDNA